MPELRRLPPGESVRPFQFAADRWGFDEYDVANQALISHHLVFGERKMHYSSGLFRYVWPGELDLIAELAGMQLEDRWKDSARTPFTSESRQRVSVWRRGAGT